MVIACCVLAAVAVALGVVIALDVVLENKRALAAKYDEPMRADLQLPTENTAECVGVDSESDSSFSEE